MCEPNLDSLQLNAKNLSFFQRIGENTTIGKINANGPDYVFRQTKKGTKRMSPSDFFKNSTKALDLMQPSICPVAAAGYSSETQQFIIANPLMSLGSLQTMFDKPRTGAVWDSTSKAITVIGILHALKVIHSRGDAHTKLQPSKVLFDGKMNPYLIDIWISSTSQDIKYAAPEMMVANKSDQKAADIFAFGLILYQIVSGISPFEGIFPSNIGPFFFSGQRPAIPESVTRFSKDLIAKCWIHDPTKRPTSSQLYQMVIEHYMDLCYDENFADVTSYVRNLLKFENLKFFTSMGDPRACSKIGEWLRENGCTGLSYEYLTFAKNHQSRLNGSRSQTVVSRKRSNVSPQSNISYQQVNQQQNMIQQPVMMMPGQVMMMPGQYILSPEGSIVSSSSSKPHRKNSKSSRGSKASRSSKKSRASIRSQQAPSPFVYTTPQNSEMPFSEVRGSELEGQPMMANAMPQIVHQPVPYHPVEDDSLDNQPTVEIDPDESSESFSSITRDGMPPPPASPKNKKVTKKPKKASNASATRKLGAPKSDTIFEAAEMGDVDDLKRFVEGECTNINVCDAFRSTPLHLVCENGHAAAAKYIVSKGGAVNRRDKWFKTPLHWAAQGGFDDIIQILLDHGADVTTEDKWGVTPLQLAAEKGHKEAVRILLKAGSDPKHTDSQDRTPISVCRDDNIIEMLKNQEEAQQVVFVKE